MELVKILEASSDSLKQGGARVPFTHHDPRRPDQATAAPRSVKGNGATRTEKKNQGEKDGPLAVQPALTA
jgi:hypothetical protein